MEMLGHPKLSSSIRQFHYHVPALVLNNAGCCCLFPVTSLVKQGCGLAPMCFSNQPTIQKFGGIAIVLPNSMDELLLICLITLELERYQTVPISGMLASFGNFFKATSPMNR